MKRRALLGTLATTMFAGCTGYVGAGGDDDPTTESPNDDSTTTREPTEGHDPEYELDVTETDPAPVENVEIDVTAPANFTVDHPAKLRIEFTNTADESREFSFGSLVPWDELWGTYLDGDDQLLLAPSDNVVPDEPADEKCWRATDSIALPAVMRVEELDPGETVSQEFYVVAAHESETCHEPGQYRFEDENYLGEGWGFSLEVKTFTEKND